MAIGLTARAVAQIRELKQQHELGPEYGLRLCFDRKAAAGERFTLDLEVGPGPRDRSETLQGVSVFCDARTYLLMGEVQVDYREADGGFVVAT